MMENDYCEQNAVHSPSRVFAYNLSNGYFGKPTKSRCSQPSMFEILTWNQQNKRFFGQQEGNKVCCNCNCECSHHNQSPNKQKKYSPQIVQNFQSPQQLQNRPKQNQNRKGQLQNRQNNQKVREQPMHRNTSHQGRNTNEVQKNQRPKSAVVKSKSVKVTTPSKLPKFIGEAIQQRDQVQQEPVETKQKLIQKFKQTTRWIPNSAFTTYFGKPAFENYGRGNTNPSFGGLMYGNYLKTHNIQPHRGVNSPKNLQSYNIALSKGHEAGTIYPYPPKASKKAHVRLGQTGQGCSDVQCTQIYGEQNNMRSLPIHAPNLLQLQKFGGKGIHKISRNRMERSQVEKENEVNGEEWERQNKYMRNSSKKAVY